MNSSLSVLFYDWLWLAWKQAWWWNIPCLLRNGATPAAPWELQFSLFMAVPLYRYGRAWYRNERLLYTDVLQIACVHRGCFHISRFKPLFSVVFFHPWHRRVAAFEAKQKQLKGQQKADAKLLIQDGTKYRGLSKEDRAIAERLEKLREERKPSEFWRDQKFPGRGCCYLKNYGREREVPGIQYQPS